MYYISNKVVSYYFLQNKKIFSLVISSSIIKNNMYKKKGIFLKGSIINIKNQIILIYSDEKTV